MGWPCWPASAPPTRGTFKRFRYGGPNEVNKRLDAYQAFARGGMFRFHAIDVGGQSFQAPCDRHHVLHGLENVLERSHATVPKAL